MPDPRRHRFRRRALSMLLVPLLGACKFGLDYSGNEEGLRRESVVIEGHDEERVLSYLATGDENDQRVIYIHGSPGLATAYADYMQDPVEGLESIAVDRLGYGNSTPNNRAVTSLAEQAESIEPLLVERDGFWPIIVGHSLGGPIVARIASDYPDRVAGVLIVAGGLNPDLEDVRWYNKFANAGVVKPFIATNVNISNDEMFACKDEVELLSKQLDRINCPVIIIHGTTDDLVSYENVEFSIQSFRHLNDVWVFTLDGEGHSVTKLRQDEVREGVESMRDYLRGDFDLDRIDESRR